MTATLRAAPADGARGHALAIRQQEGRRVVFRQDGHAFSIAVYDRGAGEGLWRGAQHRLVHALTTPPPPLLVKLDGRTVAEPLPPRDLVALYPAGCEVRSAGGSSRYAQLLWDPALLGALAPDLPGVPDLAPLIGTDRLVGRLMRGLAAELGAGTLDRLLAASAVAAIAMRAVERAGRPHPAPPIAPARLRRVLDHVEAHLGEEIGLPELAALAELSACHFSRSFKQAMGVGPRRYLLRRRVARARALLDQTDAPLAGIALTLGFADQSHFTHVFRQETGVTPARFRAGRSR